MASIADVGVTVEVEGGGTERRPSELVMLDEAKGELVCLAERLGGVAIAPATPTESLDLSDLDRLGFPSPPGTGELPAEADESAACCCQVKELNTSGRKAFGISHSSPETPPRF